MVKRKASSKYYLYKVTILGNSIGNLHKKELVGGTVAQPTPNDSNRILKNATIAMPLRYLTNFLEIT